MFKAQQVLRTTQSIRTGSSPRTTYPKGTRVVVVNQKDGKVTVRPQLKAGDPASDVRLVGAPEMFEFTRRGAPTGPRKSGENASAEA